MVYVDRTFNLSSLFLTVTVVKNKTVMGKQMQEPPIFVGLMFLHGDGKHETYLQFFSHLSGKLDVMLQSYNLHADASIMTGSDEERALAKALASAFPNAKHLFCMLHCKSNVTATLDRCGSVYRELQAHCGYAVWL